MISNPRYHETLEGREEEYEFDLKAHFRNSFNEEAQESSSYLHITPEMMEERYAIMKVKACADGLRHFVKHYNDNPSMRKRSVSYYAQMRNSLEGDDLVVFENFIEATDFGLKLNVPPSKRYYIHPNSIAALLTLSTLAITNSVPKTQKCYT